MPCDSALSIILVQKLMRLQVMCMACLVGELHTMLNEVAATSANWLRVCCSYQVDQDQQEPCA